MNTATTIAAVAYWQHVVDATLHAIDNDEGMARQELAAAERIMPVPEEAWRAVLGASADTGWAYDSPPYHELLGKYHRLLTQYEEHLNSDLTGLKGHIEDTEGEIEGLYAELRKLESENQ